MMRWRWIATLLVFVAHDALLAQSPLEEFFTQHCVKCHGPEKQMGKVRLDRSLDAIFSDMDLLETVVAVLEAASQARDGRRRVLACVFSNSELERILF